MEKYITTKDKKEVRFGDVVSIESYDTTKFGEYYTREEILFTPNSLQYLLDKGAIIEVGSKWHDNIDANFIVYKIANKLGCDDIEAWDFLYSLHELCLGAFISLIYKEVATECDKHYSESITKAKSIFIIDSMNNKVRECKNNSDYLFNQFASFRTKGDALLAMKVVDEILQGFNYGGEEN